jgi:anaerobic selenocysteine-containing dehydrogenase
MHIGGMGDGAVMARGIRTALSKTGTPLSSTPSPTSPPLNLDTKRLEEIIGHSGQAGGGVFKITIGRGGVKMHGVEVTSSMGLNTWAAFMGTNERAHVAGDVAMTAKEVNPVIRALRKGGIEVVAVHNHMIDEQPRIFFLHYWGTGPAESLARTVREAFDQVKGPVR